MKVFPVTAKSQVSGKTSPCLKYDLFLFQAGKVDINLYLSPTLNYFKDGGTELAVSFDDESSFILNMNKDNRLKTWEGWVSNNINQLVSTLGNPGKHTHNIRMVDSGVVLQRIIINLWWAKTFLFGSLGI